MADNTTTKPTTKGLGKEQGESGVVITNGIIISEEYNRDLMGVHGLNVFDKMRRSDATVHAILQMVKLPILGLTWNVEPASDDPADEKIAEFVEAQLFNGKVNWHSLLSTALTMFDFGFSVHEKTYELTDYEGATRIGLQSINFRKQTSIYAWQKQDKQPGVTQQLFDGVRSIDQAKLLVCSNEKEGDNYEGVSMLRFAYKDYYMKDSLIKVNAVSLERMGMGIPKVVFDTGSDENEKIRARALLRQMRANEEAYLEIPKGSDIEMMDMKGNTVKDILPTIQYHDRQITLSVLGQFLMLGASDASGSRAVSSDHSKMFMQSEEAAAINVQHSFQVGIIEQLCDLNFSNLPNGYPKLQHSRLEDDDVVVLADAVQKLMNAGALTADPDTEDHLRETLHLPAMPETLKTRKIDEMENPPKPPPALVPGQPPVVPPPADGNPPPTPPANTDNLPDKKAKAMANLERDKRELIDILVRS